MLEDRWSTPLAGAFDRYIIIHRKRRDRSFEHRSHYGYVERGCERFARFLEGLGPGEPNGSRVLDQGTRAEVSASENGDTNDDSLPGDLRDRYFRKHHHVYRNYEKSVDANRHQLLLVQSGHIRPYSTYTGWVAFARLHVCAYRYRLFVASSRSRRFSFSPVRKNNLRRERPEIMNSDKRLIKISANGRKYLYRYRFAFNWPEENL